MGLLAALILLQERAPDRPLEGLAAKCGSEIPWALSFEEATRRARETGRPIAWWVTTLEGSPMDRKLVIQKYMLAGPFMMPPVVELLSTRFVPLRTGGEGAHRGPYGVKPFDFIEPGLVFLTPELKVIHRADRISTFSEEWFVHLLRGVLKKAGHPVEEARPVRPAPEGDEATWRRGVALHLEGKDEEGRAEWRKIKSGRWAWKAAAELARDGPFVRGFEVFDPPLELPELPTSTTLPRREPDVKHALRFLLRTQRGNGSWDDSHYNFGGEDSLPNVYMATTALAAMALRAWGEAGPALARAERFMRDETRIAADDKDEIVWAHAYRLLYFTGDPEMAGRLVSKLAALQTAEGAWFHEYPAPFTTATVLHALDAAKKSGAEVPAGMIRRGAEALKSCRTPKGHFSYAFPNDGGAVEGAAGRWPFCEFALLLSGASTAESVHASLETSLRHHGLLERVRKYDDHADAHRNGGFFFWYDQYGRALAAGAVSDAAALRKQREILASTMEIDGAWVDSHELGRVYGTAMALLTLKLCGE